MFAVINRVKIKRGYHYACPPKTLALFAHNEEFSIFKAELPALIKLVGEECKTREKVEELVRDGSLPRITQGGRSEQDDLQPRSIADIICFDAEVSSNADNNARLMAWVSFQPRPKQAHVHI